MEEALFQAVLDRNSDKVSDYLSERNFDLNWQNPACHRRSALHLACQMGIFEITVIHLLRAPQINQNLQDGFGKTPFFIAVEEAAGSDCQPSSFKIVKEMLEDPNIDINLPDSIGLNPILVAASHGHLLMVRWMIASGRPLEIVLDSNTRLGAKFCRQVKSEEILALLREYVESPKAAIANARKELGIYGVGYDLWMAVALGEFSTVKNLLIEHPPPRKATQICPLDINWMESEFKRTPLYRACSRGFVDIVRLLLKDGRADTNHRISVGSSPLYITCQTGHVAIVKMLLSDPRVQVNLEELESKCTPLYVACANRHKEVVMAMISDPRVDLNKSNGEGSTPLFLACNAGFPEIVTVLLNHKDVDVNKKQNSGYSPFAAACWWNREEVVKMLLSDPRVDVNQTISEGWTGLLVSCYQGSVDVLKLLLKSPRVDVHVGSTAQGIENPVVAACRQNQFKALEILMEDGRFNPSSKSRRGKETPLDLAVSQNSVAIAEILFASNHLVEVTTQAKSARDLGHGALADLLDAYKAQPDGVRTRLRMKNGNSASLIFALVLFHSDDFLRLTPAALDLNEDAEVRSRQRRFFQISKKLPLELQMILCNRYCGLSKILIPFETREKAFRLVARDFSS